MTDRKYLRRAAKQCGFNPMQRIIADECGMPVDWHRARLAYREERSTEARSGYSTVDMGGEGGAGGES